MKKVYVALVLALAFCAPGCGEDGGCSGNHQILQIDVVTVSVGAPVSYTMTGSNLGAPGRSAFVLWVAPSGSGVFDGADVATTPATVLSPVEIRGSTPSVQICGPNGLSDVVVDIIQVQVGENDGLCTADLAPLAVTFEAPRLASIEIAERNFPPGTLAAAYATNTLPSTPLVGFDLEKLQTSERALVTGSGFAPVGGTVQVSITDTLGGAVFDQSGGPTFTTLATILDENTIELRDDPLLTGPNRLLADLPCELRVVLPDGSCVFEDAFLTLVAPPTIDNVDNLEAGIDQAGGGSPPADTAGFLTGITPASNQFLSALSQGIFLNDEDTADNFDPGANVIFYVAGDGPDEGPIFGCLGTDNPAGLPNGDIGDENDAQFGNALNVTAADITGQQRIAGADFAEYELGDFGIVPVRIRVTNPDRQCGEGVVQYRLASEPVNRSTDAAFSNYNCDITIDPTSIRDGNGDVDDFGVNGQASNATDTQDGLNIAVCYENDDSSGTSLYNGTEVIVEWSRDGGVTWGRTVIDDVVDGEDADAFRSFPQVAYDGFGNLWLTYLIDDFTANNPAVDFSQIRLFVSFDQGVTFVPALGDPFRAPGAGSGRSFGRPGLATGPSSAPGQQKALVVWTDGSLTIPHQVRAGEVRTPAFGNSGTSASVNVLVSSNIPPIGVLERRHPRPAVGPHGAAYVTWMELDFGTIGTDIFVDVDKDDIGAGGARFGFGRDQLAVRDIPFNHLGPPPSRPDLGTHIPLQDVECIRTGPNAGRLVVAWDGVTDNAAGNTLTQVLTTYTEDFGTSFTTPNAVVTSPGDQFLPRLAADRANGDLYVTWTDAGNDRLNEETERFSSRSPDGGDTWSWPLLLSTHGTTTAGENDGEFADYGVYAGLAVYAGVAVAAWPDNADNAGRMDCQTMMYQQR